MLQILSEGIIIDSTTLQQAQKRWRKGQGTEKFPPEIVVICAVSTVNAHRISAKLTQHISKKYKKWIVELLILLAVLVVKYPKIKSIPRDH